MWSRVHHEHRGLVIRDVGVHRADDADVVGAGAHVREELAHFEATLAVAREAERRLHQRAGLAFGGHGAARERLAVILRQHRLRIEAVHLRQPAVHEEEDDVFRARGMVQALRELRRRGLAGGEAGGLERVADQAGERHHAEAAADATERVAARDGGTGSVRHLGQLTNTNSFELSSTFT
jgi:hypothetical protein